MSKTHYLDLLLKPYQEQIIESIRAYIPQLGSGTLLKDACEYALLNGGKRVRPALVLMLGNALGYGADVSLAALGIEFFHTASLVVDDLPCMDDDEERRNLPSVHKKYGETMAILVSYALIGAGYGCYAQNAKKLKNANLHHSPFTDHYCVLTLENASFNTGLNGATGGQFLDVFPPDLTLSTLREVIKKKTISLFEISFVSGWLYGGGNVLDLDLIKKAAYHLGMVFQLADDIQDLKQDAMNNRSINMAAVMGLESTQKMIVKEIEEYKQILKQLNITYPDLINIIDLF